MQATRDERIVAHPLRIPPGERWCGGCGADVPARHYEFDSERHRPGNCPFCGSHKLFPVEAVLRPGEFYFAH